MFDLASKNSGTSLARSQPVSPAAGAPAERVSQWAARALILCATLGALHYFYSRHLTNIYGDAIAHMEGARRLSDSQTPGYAEIGSAWLPLFHLLAAPLAINDHLWRTGLAGSFVSSAAFFVLAWFTFRLAFEMNNNQVAGWVSLAAVLLCPSILYLAATPLTEPLAVMWSVLVVFGLFRYQQSGRIRVLLGAGAAVFFSTLTRYDGWFLLPFATLFVLLCAPAGREWATRLRHATLFAAVGGAGPTLWVAHNAYRFGNPLEFYNGPFSAAAIYARQLATTGFRYPTDGSWLLSLRYYLEDCKLVLGAWSLELAMLGLLVLFFSSARRRRCAAALLLLVPIVFYTESMAHAGVPLYVPTLFPHSYYNLRYGIEMLPGAALYPSFLLGPNLPARRKTAALAVVLCLYLGQAAAMTAGGMEELGVVKESLLNTPCRSGRQRAAIRYLLQHYDGRGIILAAGQWPCVMPEVGIPYRRTITEMNHRAWQQLASGPPLWVGWILRSQGDSVDQLMRAHPSAFRDFRRVLAEAFQNRENLEIYQRP
jgi:hypothetical protein